MVKTTMRAFKPTDVKVWIIHAVRSFAQELHDCASKS
jgi:hypothetical protein